MIKVIPRVGWVNAGDAPEGLAMGPEALSPLIPTSSVYFISPRLGSPKRVSKRDYHYWKTFEKPDASLVNESKLHISPTNDATAQ